MANATITTSDAFIKRLEYKIQKLTFIMQQMDILIYSATQTCRELSDVCRDECLKD